MKQNNEKSKECNCSKDCACKTSQYYVHIDDNIGKQEEPYLYKTFFTTYSDDCRFYIVGENDEIYRDLANLIKEYSIYNEGEDTVFECNIYVGSEMSQRFNIEDLLKIRKIKVVIGPGMNANNKSGPAAEYFTFSKEAKQITFKLQGSTLDVNPVVINLKIK